MKANPTRREFIKKSAIGATGISWALTAPVTSYANIIGANDRIQVGVVGINSRGAALAGSLLKTNKAQVSFLCDVDSRVLDKVGVEVNKHSTGKLKEFSDYRKLLEEKDLDAVVIATPDHWHAPMGIMGAIAGKHVYLEKPCSHNPREGELLIQAQQKYGILIQMGNQQRSAPTSIQAIQDINDGFIGKVYFGKAWYSNDRKSIGYGKVVPMPDWLDWELWQGPAPRRPYKDNLVHYNWHWFWNWGTGEINNNGAHELDICRWALGVEFPTKVISSGGRYHFKDDWEFYDTQLASFEFDQGKMISWEGRSCNSFSHYDRGRGATIHGTKGTILLDRNGYTAYNMDGEVIKELKEKEESGTTDIVGAGPLVDKHMDNFLSGIKDGVALNAPIDEGHKSVLLCHLGNIAQVHGGMINTNKKDGSIIDHQPAQEMWSREYEKGWEPKV
ncbi:MAG: Gfo/Idh/MocA family oxidoreductase [Bacteroidetes bacterium]|nr:Gfo/Idh/MocA family oxidoreductase [Bacteroidota bacterium]